MALQARSRVVAFVKEDTEGELKAPTSGSNFTAIRPGFAMNLAVNTVESDEVKNDIGRTGSFVTNEVPTVTMPKYLKGSGLEAQAPDWAPLMESAMGEQAAAPAEVNTEASSSAGTTSARAYLQFGSGEITNMPIGRAFLIKDLANGYSIRNLHSKDTENHRANLNFNLAGAPAAEVGTGRPILWTPAATGHPSLSCHDWQAGSDAGFYQAAAGLRAIGFNVNLAANGLAEINFDLEGLRGYLNPIKITASNKYIDFSEDGESELTATLTEGWYDGPVALAAEIQAKMQAEASDTITVSFDDITGKFTISSDGDIFTLDWDNGTNAANSVGSTIGFDTSADDTGATSYTADNAMSYDPGQEPSYDSNDPFVVKNQEFLIGDWFRTDLRKGSNTTITYGLPKTNIPDFTAKSGQSESQVNERTVTLSTTLTFRKHMIDQYHKMKQNQDEQLMFNCGVKDSAGNWVPGKCFNFWFPAANITSHVVSESDGIMVVQIEVSGKVTSTFKDVYINHV